MRHLTRKAGHRRLFASLSAAAIVLGAASAPAYAGGDISNFTVRNCSDQRIFVCSFDKTDSLMKIPYKARGIQPGEKREFGCASIGRCKVIIGVSKKKSKKTLSDGMEAALSTGAVVAAGGAAAAGGVYLLGSSSVAAGAALGLTAYGAAGDAAILAVVGSGAVGAAVIGVGVGGAVAAIEIADGWSDGKVCNQVKNAARRMNLKPKHYMQDGKHYQVIEKYAKDKDSNIYVHADGSAMMAYDTQRKKGKCSVSLQTQLIKK